MKNELKSIIIFVIIGMLMGYISFLVANNIASFLLAVFVLIILSFALKKILKVDEKLKWFFTNGGWYYLFFWFIVWIIFYNL